ncbi:MAG: cyclic pyranopterin monophosphate synthase MoaC [Thermoproteus sp.]|jgi:cyclic pyranopterin phosphate synthase|uniref:cyclic pyranopterin monophosphate synthase MoaC n=1 Tax=Thermoproteus sp. CP80 TaxID=1650659 RepID=UPI001EDD344F|nr:cyclic pyranopterin monophosphate synthase MoaC [Thermoproteus sp. CP80]MDT7870257.1 cyclic pyranopterin monophosphate synthase MoaC [Thermoproteus sp.]MDT7882477.1 cyclic pyranopterin monophosphate synthase MoaC [Thermoproteus sp.]
MVDISAKGDVARYAEASAEASVADPIGCAVAASLAAKQAYRYIPLLHPVPLSASAECGGGAVEARAWTVWRTGVEMDALFGALVGAIAAGAASIRRLRVDTKIKGVEYRLEEPRGSVKISRPDLGYVVKAYGYIHLTSTAPIKAGSVEKGDPICAARTVAPLNAKRLCELLPVDCVKLEYANSKVEVGDDTVAVEVVLKGRDASPSLEALFAAGSALLTIWDMLKKYEKDENGQYPDTYVELGL